MDQFVIEKQAALFQKTNSVWNKMRLNDPWCVGFVSYLIDEKPFLEKKAWQKHYFASGLSRKGSIEQLPERIRAYLYTLPKERKAIIKKSPELSRYDRLNYYYGRTERELKTLANFLFQTFSNKDEISLELCENAVRYRVLDETWQGIVLRERNTILALKNYFPALETIKINAKDDHFYAVDYILIKKDKPFCGIQIKPISYNSHKPYVKAARQANLKKNNKFILNYKIPVYTVLADTNGRIKNLEELIKKLKRNL